MHSKKTLTALVVATLFASSAFAAGQTVVQGQLITGGYGYSEAKDDFFQLAIDGAKGKPAKVVVSAYSKNADPGKDGTRTVSLKGNSYTLASIDFDYASGLKNTTHQSALNLDDTKMSLSTGVIFRNASAFAKEGLQDQLPAVEDLKSINRVNLANNSQMSGDVINHYSEAYSGGYYNNGLTIATRVDVLDGSIWTGNLVDSVSDKHEDKSSPVMPEDVKSEFIVNLKNGASWVGGIQKLEQSTAEVKLDNTSSWTVTGNSTVNAVLFDDVQARNDAQTQGVILSQGANLTISHGSQNSIINNMKFDAGSTLTVDNAKLTINNVAGSSDIVLNENGVVDVKAATDKLNATLASLEGTKLTTADTVQANVTVSGALVDEKGMSAVIKQFDENGSYSGKGTVLFSGGLIADDVVGYAADGKFVQTGTRKSAKLVSIGESTALTMMQWRSDADDMAQRLGDLRNNEGAVGLWARTFGGKAEVGHISNEYYGIQVGADTVLAANGPKHIVGGAFSYTTGDADFSNGSGDNYMGALTGYSTWLFEGGTYVDVSAKWGKLNNEFDFGAGDSKFSGQYNTNGVALAIEAGHRIPVTGLAYVEPQIGFTASHIFSKDYNATQGIRIEQDSIDSYVARIGVQAGLNCPDNMGSVYARASYLYDFDGETSTSARSAVTHNSFSQDFGGGWYELGLGMNVNFTKNLQGYADFEYVAGGEIDTPYRWNAGVRYAF